MHMYYVSATRMGTILHSLLYLTGIPIFLENLSQNGDSNCSHNTQSVLFTRSNVTEYFLNSSFYEIHRDDKHINDTWREKCYSGSSSIYCVKMRYPNRRGFYLFPDPMEEIAPTICLYTHKMPNTCQVVDSEIVNRLDVVGKSKKSYWVTHGYMENGNRPWIIDMVHELVEVDVGANVFVLDWSQGARPPYSQAVANIELISQYTGDILYLLQQVHGLNVSNVHFIGHSLGSHLGGLIGTWLKDHKRLELGRITGLDPAQPYFQNYPVDARLDPSDAAFVDVIHTDARPLLQGGAVSGLGTQESSGHADFFPNNGRDQPGCKDGVYQAILQEDGSFLYGIRRFLGCDHMRAYEYFTESIRSPCRFMGFSCPSYQDFISLNCSNALSNRMGFHATNPHSSEKHKSLTPVNYYLITASKTPYCRDHYKVTIKLVTESTYRSDSDLHLVLLNGEGGPSSYLTLDSTEVRGRRLIYKYLREGVYINSPIIRKVILRPVMSNPLRWFVNRMGPKTPDVTLESISILHLESGAPELIYCPEGRPFFSVSDQNPNISLSLEACPQ